ncbi:MAG: sporulation protein YabP [Firmicutes bacterium]|nr:sporulation protein YabP [Bacillota bacterium]MBR4020681.1 sporulation protein YabP [Bacillota bacterium]
MNHEINICNKTNITVSAVSSIDGFDENCIFVNLQQEGLLIYGKNLHIEGLDLEAGVLTAAGQIESIAYAKKKEKKSLRERFRR